MQARSLLHRSILPGIALFLGMSPAFGHFLALIPSSDLVSANDEMTTDMEISFMHPFEGERMDMAPPARLGVRVGGKTKDLASALQAEQDGPSRWYRLSHRLMRPGDHVFFIEPAPYWEPAENAFIVHQTKVVVNAVGLEAGWDEPLGLTAEIVPLTRPYGLWAGNLFTGRVLHRGKPVAFAEVEVTLYRGRETIGKALPVQQIQVVRADRDGVFSYTMPTPGWWGFAALLQDDRALPGPDGRSYPVELGAVIWVKAYALD